jgi:hypothetical protein
MLKLSFLLKSTAFFIAIYALAACDTEGVKLNRGDREHIDTTSSKIIYAMSKQMDSLCLDSTPIWRQRAVDSLLQVREREIMMQTQPVH